MEYYWLCDCYVVSFLPDFERTTIDRYKSIYEYCFHRFSSSFRLFFFLRVSRDVQRPLCRENSGHDTHIFREKYFKLDIQNLKFTFT